MRIVVALAFGTILSCLCLPARADKVPPPPPDCLPGSTARTGHGGPYCDPKTCEADSDCEGGETCQERALCIAEFKGGGRRPENVEPPTYHSVVNTCDKADGSACSLPAEAANRYWGKKDGTCQSLKTCLAGGAAAAPPKSSAAPTATPTAKPSSPPEPQPSAKTPDKPPTATDKPPCSCAGANGELPASTVALVLLWLVVLWRARD